MVPAQFTRSSSERSVELISVEEQSGFAMQQLPIGRRLFRVKFWDKLKYYYFSLICVYGASSKLL